MATQDPKPDAFTPEVAARLKTYVYRLIDPRNGETFYVGKGRGNRVFAHVRAESDLDGEQDEASNKLRRIREIHLAGFEVAHVIHRHGMDEDTAFEVESALIEAYPGLTNEIGGSGGAEFGVMHAREIISKYAAAEAVFQHRALLINVNRTATANDLYQATRYAWRICLARAREAQVVLATTQGLIVGAFVATEWREATAANFPDREPMPGRMGFVGHPADQTLKNLYLLKRVPDVYRRRGAANPIKYTW